MMKRLFKSLLMALFCALSLTAWADADKGEFAIAGSLENGIQFRLDLNYYGESPAVVTGYTMYFRKDGSTSIIPVYGTWNDEGVQLQEVIDNKECGNFAFSFNESHKATGSSVSGNWHLQGKYIAFQDVKVTEIAADYTMGRGFCNFLLPLQRTRTASGFYLLEEESGSRAVNVMVGKDSVTWSFTTIEGGKVTCKMEFINRNGQTLGGKIGNFEFTAYTFDDFIYIRRTNPQAGRPDALPQGVTLEGFYPKRSSFVSKSYEKIFPKKADDEEDFVISAEGFVEFLYIKEIPGRKNPLTEIIQNYLIDKIGEPEQYYEDWVAKRVRADFEEMEMGEEEYEEYNKEMGHMNYLFNYFSITMDTPTDKLLTRTSSSAGYLGGAHSYSGFTTEQIRLSDGKIMTWEDWFVNPESLRPLITKYMKAQNEGFDIFDTEDGELDLLTNAPIFTGTEFEFSYQLYWIDTLTCTIKLSELLPYLTPAAKELVK